MNDVPATPRPDDVCARPDWRAFDATAPLAAPIHLASVYRCDDPAQAAALLANPSGGFVYSRDGHPNAAILSDKLSELHGCGWGVVCGSGMSALSAACLSHLKAGDVVVAGKHLYGRTLTLLSRELPRLGVECRVVDTSDLVATERALAGAKLVVVETLSNPTLRVADVPALAKLAHAAGALLLVDNTFAGPTVFRPLEHGADLVMESLTKIVNGHSDVLLGFLGGRRGLDDRTSLVLSAWGLSAPPFECWLAARGLATLALRADRANDNALRVARHLRDCAGVSAWHFPGLPDDPGHALASRLFGSRFGTVVTFTLAGGLAAAERFIRATREVIPFCPSLGDLSTTLSHPASTSHRGMSADEQRALGVTGGTIRLSVGVESAESIVAALDAGLAAARSGDANHPEE